MADILLTETIFTGRPDTDYGTSGVPNKNIVPNVLNPPASDAWTDYGGNCWAVKNGFLTFNPAVVTSWW
jgi:hypothetical protein